MQKVFKNIKCWIILISKVVKNIKNFPTVGGSDKIKNFLSSKISQVREGGGLKTWEHFPSFTTWLILTASLNIIYFLDIKFSSSKVVRCNQTNVKTCRVNICYRYRLWVASLVPSVAVQELEGRSYQ